jgi:hypothetical protein
MGLEFWDKKDGAAGAVPPSTRSQSLILAGVTQSSSSSSSSSLPELSFAFAGRISTSWPSSTVFGARGDRHDAEDVCGLKFLPTDRARAEATEAGGGVADLGCGKDDASLLVVDDIVAEFFR